VPYEPNPWLVLPFALLLAMIALAPLCFARWWTRHYPKVAIGLGLVTLAYYLGFLPGEARQKVWETAHEYVSFIALIGSLFIVSGGIHIQVKGEATPWANVAFLAVGAVLANVLGTTGASMLLIRPWLRSNQHRVSAHHVVFFIFIVANVGGCLTPIGDPPLFAGFLKGVPFWWVAEHCWPMWAVGVGTLLLMFFAVDRRNHMHAPPRVRQPLAETPERWRVEGLHNLGFLALILVGVFVERPLFLREALMVGAAAGSWWTTKKRIHEANAFHWQPIQEVAVLFLGLFATMLPALDWLEANAGRFGTPAPAFFYWTSGVLSSALDNMPTYLCFLKAIFGAFVDADSIGRVQHLIASGGTDLASFVQGPHAEEVKATFAALQKYHGAQVLAKSVTREEIEVAFLLGNAKFNAFILAISVGAVFFGANTYIGNGPNFMVKAIAEHARVRTPGFLGYMGRFTLPFMLPMLLLIWLIFFKH
jgi:Na+/H+ antiporter NhaD/arsenite permease-like protein